MLSLKKMFNLTFYVYMSFINLSETNTENTYMYLMVDK